MDVIVIFNGLGNQMSQYAFYLQKKSINKSTHFISFCRDHNGFELDSVFKITSTDFMIKKLLYILFRILLTDKIKVVTIPLKRILKILNCKIVREDFDYSFNEDYLKASKGITFYYGGWHTEKYFFNEKEALLSAFKFDDVEEAENIEHSKIIANCNSVSIHVRRGDFLNSANVNLFGGVCTKEYFQKAISNIESKIETPHFFVFSNDMEWVKQNLSISTVTYVTWNTGKNSWKDMYLMSLCKHNIIPNSTFSWWGAWLNKNPQKIIISPSRFLNNDKHTDVYPESWVKISDY
ncbi:alpha-1,2-fucosyltransferase [Flavobacterium palustre]|uniref:Alpha-1,2-fucosyltransferase n=1 Tax=Flavobacterium palustre TaxID=1476463 RepID=A0ABQ1H7U4_9FLAO|nr:alpha-1,2-fucosyltransferase [Flavobacterium palustre]GGA63288.1 alpha-1,2-fucosyltransferase [Flavobacterium palustre]